MKTTHSFQKPLSVLIALLSVLLPLVSANSVTARYPLQSETAVAGDPQPVLLKDIYTADASSDPNNFLDFGDKFFYSGYDPAYGRELWISDGTADGTSLVADIIPGPEASNPSNWTHFRDKIFFTAYNSPDGVGHGLWYTDGTSLGTKNVFTTIWDFGYGSVDGLIPVGDWLYFVCGWNLLRYGGPENKWERVLPNNFVLGEINIAVKDGSLFFSATDGASGYEFWRYTPATGQISLVKDICPEICLGYEDARPGSHPNNFTIVGSLLYFTAVDAIHGMELWVSDGSETGTYLVKDLQMGLGSSSPSLFMPAAEWLYFTANDSEHGKELWRSDGTAANTTMIADLAPGDSSSSPEYLTVLNSGESTSVVFSARDGTAGEGHGVELWSVQVTAVGANARPTLIEIAPGTTSGMPKYLKVFGSSIYFAAQSTSGNIELWKTDGSPETTMQVADLVPGTDGSAPESLSTWNGKLVFSAVDAINGREPWISDGTIQGTSIVGNIAYAVDAEGSSPSAGIITNVGGWRIRYFHARDPLHGLELWRTDGTAEGTWLVKDIYPGPGTDFNYCSSSMAEMNGILYFCGYDPDYGMNLWRSDGTTSGTWMVKVIYPGYDYAEPNKFTPVRNQLFFTAYDHDHGNELWVSDGTEAGTHIVKDILPGNTGTRHIQSMAGIGNQLIFGVDTEPYKWSLQLWRSDGTANGTQKFAGPYTFTASCGYLFQRAEDGKSIYFSMCDPTSPDNSSRLWVTDGTASGTKMISWSGTYPYVDPERLVSVGGKLYFAARSTLPGVSYNAITLWTTTYGSVTADLVDWWLGSYSTKYMGALNPSTLMLLTHSSYGDEDVWWMIDTKTGQMGYLSYGSYPHRISNPTSWLGKMYFTAGGSNDLPNGLWVTDGTTPGTMPVPNPLTSSSFTALGDFLSTFNNLYFSAEDGIHGREPWVISIGEVDQIFLPAVLR